ncbi:hypothetical protein INT45_007453 [Circinella minor]|uniref:Uncharacterized protein n=1 Tax=Circinella minor TaxID=1195481 RepID=A0A8H7SG11_9FUNG|nr:hypothetical protein INT45_007453 [Circinella minor]
MEKNVRSGTYRILLKNWYFLVIFNIILLIIFLGYCYRPIELSQHIQQQSGNPNNNVNHKLPSKLNQEQIETYLTSIQDNKEYVVEATMIRLFPTRANDIIHELQDHQSRFYLFKPFWSWWYKRKAWKQQITSLEFPPPAPGESSMATGPEICGSPESLPLPLLRYIVTANLGLSTHSIFDYPTKIKKPFVYITQANIQLCVTVIIPEDPPFNTDISANNSEYIYHPALEQLRRITSPWWDSIMISAWNMDTDGVIPIRMEPWRGHIKLRDEWISYVEDKPHFMLELESMMHERKTMHIYQGSVTLMDPGRYKVDARLDYQEGKWNFENGPIVPYKVQQITDIYPPGIFNVQKQLEEQHHHQQDSNSDNENVDDSTLQRVVKEHMSLPLCTRMDLPGRWLPSSVLSPTEEPAALALTEKFWAPYSCRLRRISYSDFGACLANKYSAGIDTFGDSNTRRMIKKIVTHGRWCDDWNFVSKAYKNYFKKINNVQHQYQQKGKREEETNIHHQNTTNPLNWDYTGEEGQLRACYCEDFGEPGWNREWFDATSRRQSIWVGNRTTGVPLRSHKWDGLTYLNDPPWDQEMDHHPSGDIAIFSIGNWDAAFLTLEHFQRELSELVELVAERYQHYKYVIYRTPQYYCCRADHSSRYRHISGQRVQLFNQVAKRKFKARVKNLMIWDTYSMGESRTWREKQLSNTCFSNHVSADVVEVENQILMNGLCNS